MNQVGPRMIIEESLKIVLENKKLLIFCFALLQEQ